jgi:hypothetical protein
LVGFRLGFAKEIVCPHIDNPIKTTMQAKLGNNPLGMRRVGIGEDPFLLRQAFIKELKAGSGWRSMSSRRYRERRRENHLHPRYGAPVILAMLFHT